ncbi:MAG: HAMP domain-containing sensor histidine kinase [Alphaproteobacteria bacterium]|nr:HAMP domain-containing sensor histidine kinase [Alphaproteobacteria bacterium]
MFFVMLVEVFVYAPSVARYRKVYFEERIAGAHLATLALEAAPDHMIGRALKKELLDHARAYAVVTRQPGQRKLMLLRDMPPRIDRVVDMRKGSFTGWILDAFGTMLQSKNRILRVIGRSPKDSTVLIEVVLDETPLRAELYDYSQRILVLSLIISLVTAILVYFSLHWLLVRPMRRLTTSMTEFAAAPENPEKVMVPSRRSDEVGVAERQLRAMQMGLRDALRQRARLAAVGEAVAKINHDLRNMLSTASLVSDRLTDTTDPEVKRVTPMLVRAIDRAVVLCTDTLDFTRNEAIEPKKMKLKLRAVIEDVGSALPLEVDGGSAKFDNKVEPDFEVMADRGQLFRALSNLGANALEAGAGVLVFSACAKNGSVSIDVSDDGPGLPKVAREHLFEPFSGSARSGGTGLGLAISRELAQAHGGDLKLVSSSGKGTIFRIVLPLG